VSAEVALEARAGLGEGPLWDPDARRLLWVDIMAGRVHAFDPAGGEDRSVDVGKPVGAVALRDRGGLALAVHDGFALLDGETGAVKQIADVETDRPQNRMNDGRCDRAGRFLAGTLAMDGTPGAAALYCLEPDGTVRRLLEGVTTSNGLDWSPDGGSLYYIDTPTRRLDRFAYDVERGQLRADGIVATTDDVPGMPDGMTCDVDGNLWVAFWEGGRVRCYAPDGRLLAEERLPVSLVTSCTFGGPALDELYVTSARDGLTPEQLAREPLAGAIFRLRPGIRGRRPIGFAG
jgi:sugar lactone lactonase YvrE